MYVLTSVMLSILMAKYSRWGSFLIRFGGSIDVNWIEVLIKKASPPPLSFSRSFLTKVKLGMSPNLESFVNLVS